MTMDANTTSSEGVPPGKKEWGKFWEAIYDTTSPNFQKWQLTEDDFSEFEKRMKDSPMWDNSEILGPAKVANVAKGSFASAILTISRLRRAVSPGLILSDAALLVRHSTMLSFPAAPFRDAIFFMLALFDANLSTVLLMRTRPPLSTSGLRERAFRRAHSWRPWSQMSNFCPRRPLLNTSSTGI